MYKLYIDYKHIPYDDMNSMISMGEQYQNMFMHDKQTKQRVNLRNHKNLEQLEDLYSWIQNSLFEPLDRYEFYLLYDTFDEMVMGKLEHGDILL